MKSQQRPQLATNNVFSEAFDHFTDTALYSRLVEKFKPKPYYIKFKPLRVIALVASYLFNVFSGVTASVLVFFFAYGLTGSTIAAGIITTAFLAVLEITKRRTFGVLFRDAMQYRKASPGLIALALFALTISGLSITSSYFGADRTIREFTADPQLVNADTITAPIRAELAEIDQQITDARNTKWMGTTTRTSQQAIKNLTEQKAALVARLVEIESRADRRNDQLEQEHQARTEITAGHFAAVTLFLELLFILCAFYLEFYDYRSLAEFAETKPTEPTPGPDSTDTPLPYEKPVQATTDGHRYTNPAIFNPTSNGNGNGVLNGHDPQAVTHRRIGFFTDRHQADTGNDTRTGTTTSAPHTKIVCDDTSTTETIPDDRRRTCRNCGEPYTYNHKKQKYCSTSCRKEYWRKQNGREPYLKRRK
jgi:hypothetical protein